MSQLALWVGFNVFVLFLLVLDLGVFHRKSHTVSVREALIWTGVWFLLAMLFNLGIYHYEGREPALQFFAGYVLEKSLSVDNIFVFILIFNYFKVPPLHQHKILFWGVLGALVMRITFILAGVALIARFSWIMYIFGVFLIITGFKMAFGPEREVNPDQNIMIRLLKKLIPVTNNYHGDHFFTRINGKLTATPMFVTLLVVETTDVIFAVDSIPAILALTSDSFIVYTSNVFAILGLRSLYFALAGLMDLFVYLKYGLAIVLSFVGVKMLLGHTYKIPISWSLGVIGGVLAISMLASLVGRKNQ